MTAAFTRSNSAASPRRTPADYLFSGLLKTSNGVPWYGEKHRYYRAGNAHAPVCDVESTLLAKMADDLRSSTFAHDLVKKARNSYGREFTIELQRLQEAEATLARRISGFMDMAEKLETRDPVLRKIEEIERDRKQIAREMDQARRDAATAAAARNVTEIQVNRMLDAMASDMQRLDREQLKNFLFTVCERITLSPDTLIARIHWKIPLSRRNNLASPRATESIPHAKTISSVKIRRAA